MPLSEPRRVIPLHAKHYADDDVASSANFAAATERSPWLLNLYEAGAGILAMNASRRVKLGKFFELSDRINEAVAPFTACSAAGRGCSECCKQSVTISRLEAERIASFNGRPMSHAPARHEQEAERTRYFGTPCPFLANGSCSVYEHRPLICRLHTNIGASPYACSTTIPPEESRVASLDFSQLMLAYGFLIVNDVVADIRSFFPNQT